MAVDDLGVLRLTTGDRLWYAVPGPFREAVVRATRPEHVVRAMTQGPSALSAKQQQRLLQPAGGAPAVLAPGRTHARALDLGTGWAKLDDALLSLGAEVTSADWCYARLRFRRLLGQPGPDVAVHVDPVRSLPFPDAYFDLVFVDAVELERSARQRTGVAEGRNGVSPDDMLSEVVRVLAPDGTVVYRSANPLRRTTTPKRLGELVRIVRAAARPWGKQPLEAVGLTVDRVFAASPARGTKHDLLPLDTPSRYLLTGGTARSAPPLTLHRGVTKEKARAAARAAARPWLASHYYLVARRSSSDTGRALPLVETLDPFAGRPAPVVRMLTDTRVALMGKDVFVKFPLSEAQQRTLLLEEQKTQAARSTYFAPYLVSESRVQCWRNVPYVAFPRLEQRPERFPGEALAVLDEILSRHLPTDVRPLPTTRLWARMTSDRGREDITRMDADSLYQWVRSRCATHHVPVGPTHGDLHEDNVLLSTNGPVLVDWNRLELENPSFLDPAYAAVRAFQRRTGTSLSMSLAAFADGQLDGPLAARADSILGDLDRLAGTVLVLLDRIVSYSEPRHRIKPWTIEPLSAAVVEMSSRLS